METAGCSEKIEANMQKAEVKKERILEIQVTGSNFSLKLHIPAISVGHLSLDSMSQ